MKQYNEKKYNDLMPQSTHIFAHPIGYTVMTQKLNLSGINVKLPTEYDGTRTHSRGKLRQQWEKFDLSYMIMIIRWVTNISYRPSNLKGVTMP